MVCFEARPIARYYISFSIKSTQNLASKIPAFVYRELKKQQQHKQKRKHTQTNEQTHPEGSL